MVAEQVLHRFDAVASQSHPLRGVDRRVHHQIVRCVNRHRSLYVIPTAPAFGDLLHWCGIDWWRGFLESCPELVEIHAGGHVDAVHGVGHPEEIGGLGGTCHGIPQHSMVGLGLRNFQDAADLAVFQLSMCLSGAAVLAGPDGTLLAVCWASLGYSFWSSWDGDWILAE